MCQPLWVLGQEVKSGPASAQGGFILGRDRPRAGPPLCRTQLGMEGEDDSPPRSMMGWQGHALSESAIWPAIWTQQEREYSVWSHRVWLMLKVVSGLHYKMRATGPSEEMVPGDMTAM